MDLKEAADVMETVCFTDGMHKDALRTIMNQIRADLKKPSIHFDFEKLDKVIENNKQYIKNAKHHNSTENPRYEEHVNTVKWLEELKAYRLMGITPDQMREIDADYTQKCIEVEKLRKESDGK